MSANPSTVSELPQPDGWPAYPGFGSDEDALARMQLLAWISGQIGVTIHPKPGDHILATDGRVLGVGPDSDELFRQVIEADPALQNVRIVEYTVPPLEW
jgi:hypothetical protein